MRREQRQPHSIQSATHRPKVGAQVLKRRLGDEGMEIAEIQGSQAVLIRGWASRPASGRPAIGLLGARRL